ncbi:MAG TPA: WYL domain-containing protein [Acidimicrobiales bacterium]|nr:WYL domain-containing protein [Acidimicrobiales bacterium]
MSTRAPQAPARTKASDRVARMLAMVPWIASHDGPTVDEICERFQVGRRKLLEDLEVLSLVGVPPYTPDTLIEVTIEGDRVWLRFADVFARPLHLTPEQGLALVVAGRASQALPGTDAGGPLATALVKVAGVLGVDPGDAVTVALGQTRPGVLDELRRAAAAGRRVRLDYYAYNRDQRTTRDVDPHAVFAHEGAWYVRAYCHQAKDQRLFRVDRIYGVDVLDQTFTPPADPETGDVFRPGPDTPRVTLDLAPAARWVVETYPVDESGPAPDGRPGWLRVRLWVSATPWLERLLVRLGPDAQVVDADVPGLADAGRDAARRILGRYRPRAAGGSGTVPR